MSRFTKINKNFVLSTLCNTLGFQRKRFEEIGEVVELSARDALHYVITTSHGYLDNSEPDSLYRLTRDHFRVFNQACKFDLQEGLFSRSDISLVMTVNNEVKRKPYILRGPKYVLPVEYENYVAYQSFLSKTHDKILSTNLNPNDFIIAPIRKSGTTVSEFESFFEYVVSKFFNKAGYITDSQIPFFYGRGTPDIAAYGIPHAFEALVRNGFIQDGGSIVELMFVSSFGLFEPRRVQKSVCSAIVCEVKTGQASAPQMKKYIETGIFDKAYEVIPILKTPESYAGLITIDCDGNLKLLEATKPIAVSEIRRSEYFQWLEIYLKMYLLGNLTTHELERLVTSRSFNMTISGLIKCVRSLEVIEVARTVRQILASR